jgi:hypothetical protein
MNPAVIEGHDLVIGKPRNWDESIQGKCHGLPVRYDQQGPITFMRSAWEPTDAELAHLVAGGKVLLGISAAVHPVVSMGVSSATIDEGQKPLPHYLLKEAIDADGKRWCRAIVVVGDISFPAGMEITSAIDFPIAAARLLKALDVHLRERGLVE